MKETWLSACVEEVRGKFMSAKKRLADIEEINTLVVSVSANKLQF